MSKVKKAAISILMLNLLYVGAGIDSITAMQFLFLMIPGILSLTLLIAIKLAENIKEQKMAAKKRNIVIRRVNRRKNFEAYLKATAA